MPTRPRTRTPSDSPDSRQEARSRPMPSGAAIIRRLMRSRQMRRSRRAWPGSLAFAGRSSPVAVPVIDDRDEGRSFFGIVKSGRPARRLYRDGGASPFRIFDNSFAVERLRRRPPAIVFDIQVANKTAKPHPTSPLPPGEGGPKGRVRVVGSAEIAQVPRLRAPTLPPRCDDPHPPLRGYPLPPGEGTMPGLQFLVPNTLGRPVATARGGDEARRFDVRRRRRRPHSSIAKRRTDPIVASAMVIWRNGLRCFQARSPLANGPKRDGGSALTPPPRRRGRGQAGRRGRRRVGGDRGGRT